MLLVRFMLAIELKLVDDDVKKSFDLTHVDDDVKNHLI